MTIQPGRVYRSAMIAVDPGKKAGIAVFDMQDMIFECVHCEDRDYSQAEPVDYIDVFGQHMEGNNTYFVTENQYVNVNIAATMRLVEERAKWEFAAKFCGAEVLPAIYAQAWQVKLLGIKPGTKREERKERSQAFACRAMGRSFVGADAADAVCIGVYACMERGWVMRP